MSKSGLYAHFGSKEELQLATVDTALEIFNREVTQPALRPPRASRGHRVVRGVPGVSRAARVPGWLLLHLRRVGARRQAGRRERPRPRRLLGILEGFAGVIEQAKELGQIDAKADVAQLVFELDSLLLGANIAYVFFGDLSALDRARQAIGERLEREAPPRAAARPRKRGPRSG